MSAARFSCGIRTSAGSATGKPLVSLWNPHASISIYVVEIWAFLIATGLDDSLHVVRISTRGVPTATVTPTAKNHLDNRFAPISGALLDSAGFSTLPTIQGPAIARLIRSGAGVGAGAALQWNGSIEIPAGTGIALSDESSLGGTAQSDIQFVWDE